MNDLISRQVALDALTEYWKGISDRHPTLDGEMAVYADCKGIIKRLPSAQPQTCDDAISREDAKWVVFCNRDHVEDQANAIDSLPCVLPSAQQEQRWIPCSERLPNKEERKEWIDNNLDGIGYLYPCLVTRYSSFNLDRAKNNPYVAKHYFDGEDFLNAGEEVCSEYIIAWMPLPEPYQGNRKGEQHEID